MRTQISRRDLMVSTAAVSVCALVPESLTKAFGQSCPPALPEAYQLPAIYRSIPSMLALRANVLLQQIHSNLNYYGKGRNWVPPISLISFQTSLQPILDNLSTVDNFIYCLDEAHNKSSEILRNISNSIQANDQIASSLKQNIQDANTNIISLISIIAELGAEIAAQYQAVLAEQAKFNAAVLANASPKCGFAQTLAILEAVVAVVGAVYTAGASLALLATSAATAATSVANSIQSGIATAQQLKDAYSSVKTIVSDVEQAEGDLDKINDAYKKLAARVDLSVTPDAGRVSVNQDDYTNLSKATLNKFDTQVQSAPVSQVLKDEFIGVVHKYAALIDTRNQKISDHDALVFSIQDSAAGIVKAADRGAQLHGSINKYNLTGNIPSENDYRVHLQDIQDQQKSLVLEMLSDEHAAMALVAMDPTAYPTLSLSSLLSANPSTANLISIHTAAQANALHLDIIRGQGQTPTKIRVERSLNLFEKVYLQKSRAISIFIEQKDFGPFMSEIFVTALSFSTDAHIPGLTGKISHLGQQDFVARSGKPIVFTSGVFSFGINADGGSPIDTTQGGQYFGFSGLGGWRVELSPGIDLSHLQKIAKIYFDLDITYHAADNAISA